MQCRRERLTSATCAEQWMAVQARIVHAGQNAGCAAPLTRGPQVPLRLADRYRQPATNRLASRTRREAAQAVPAAAFCACLRLDPYKSSTRLAESPSAACHTAVKFRASEESVWPAYRFALQHSALHACAAG